MLLAALAGCGDSGEQPNPQDPLGDPAATEASPESPPAPSGGGSGAGTAPLSDADAEAVSAATRRYIDVLNAGDGEALCLAFVPGAVPERELPRRRGDCAGSIDASIGYARPGGTPAWRRTIVRELTAVSVGGGRARVTATVTHDFADRNYTSIEEDVIYLDRRGEQWLIAKPSASFYRAVGYPEPPLRALTPP